jgi:aminopeptidase N
VYGVNHEGSGDMYYKGGNMIHTIRQLVNDDEKFRQLLRGLNETFWHQTVTSKEIENYISQTTGIDCSKIFDQYLRSTKIPTLEYKVEKGKLSYRWTNCVPGFSMKVKLANNGGWIAPSEQWKKAKGTASLQVDRNFYIEVKDITASPTPKK